MCSGGFWEKAIETDFEKTVSLRARMAGIAAPTIPLAVPL